MRTSGIEILEAYGFEKKLDKIGRYCNKNRWVYFLESRNKGEYLVFSSNCFDKKLQPKNFDSWIDTYNSVKQIGTTPPLKSKILKFSFNFCEDIDLLKKIMPIKSPKKISRKLGLSLKDIKEKHKSE
ncbi:hypothetical protein [Aquimarina sediminis]|uniref:hypothetical protein n=1 Tax=Aquimarina sediminis TaxID=2070536 RepID=UPI000CA088DB|nr:hypothetical protein [Aquimarina sediminis]